MNIHDLEGRTASLEVIIGDITGTLGIAPNSYAGVVSAGTFTHGHVGPEGLAPLLDVAKSGAIFVLSINRAHFEKLGFQAEIDALGSKITNVRLRDIRIYDDRADRDHRNDLASLLIFKRA